MRAIRRCRPLCTMECRVNAAIARLQMTLATVGSINDMHEHHLHALSQAWLITLIAVTLFVASIAISNIWDQKTIAHGLVDVLLTNAL
jgi:hypothetical protein